MENTNYIETPEIGKIMFSGEGNNSLVRLFYSYLKSNDFEIKCTVFVSIQPNERMYNGSNSFVTKNNFKGEITIEAKDALSNMARKYFSCIIPFSAFKETAGLEIIFNDYHGFHAALDDQEILPAQVAKALYEFIYPLLVDIKQKPLNNEYISILNHSGKKLLDHVYKLSNV